MNRYLVTGVRIHDKKKITGYLVVAEDVAYVFPADKSSNADKDVIVDKNTIEPLAEKIYLEPIYENPESRKIVGYDPLCPNCNYIFNTEKEGEPEYCIECGQRIDWSVCNDPDL